ncbi:MAG: glycosyl hydrolase family 79 C-terminal domain-containing protein [Actinomycetota bacterium]|nr:glycosyl hydrolase family 79 C-terminal domain-containing protein [Actinomycetota bacterium]
MRGPLVLLAAVGVALAGFTSRPASGAAGSSAVIVQVGHTMLGRPVPAGFVGMSFEFKYLTSYAGANPRALNPVLIALMRNLTPGQTFTLRIGGNSTDWTWWPVRGFKRPAGVSFSLAPAWLAVGHRLALAADARLILGIDLEAGSPPLAAAEARALLAGVGRAQVEALEIGNEPEAYRLLWYFDANGHSVPGRPPGYGFKQYRREFSRLRLLLGDVALAGPATGSPSWLANVSRFITAEPTLREVTFHYYPLSRCVNNPASPQYPTVSNLLSWGATQGLVSGLSRYTTLAHRHGVVFRVDELNSVTCHGRAGVSDTFASALWMLDTLFQMARAGVDAVNIHSWPPAVPNELFTFTRNRGRWTGVVRPIYYGALMFARVAPPGSRLLWTGGTGGRPVRMWAVRLVDGSTRVLVINNSTTHAYSVVVRPLERSGAGALERLIAPSAYATGGVTIAGQSFRAPTATGSLVGPPHATVVSAVDGGYRFRVPAASAASLKLAS